jgi:hypothetical protein
VLHIRQESVEQTAGFSTRHGRIIVSYRAFLTRLPRLTAGAEENVRFSHSEKLFPETDLQYTRFENN